LNIRQGAGNADFGTSAAAGGSGNTLTLGTGNDTVSFTGDTNTVKATSTTLNAGATNIKLTFHLDHSAGGSLQQSGATRQI
jgi:hypothetical protein